MGYGIVGLLVLIAIVLVLAKVAVAGGILGLIAVILLVLVLLGRV
jgi:flagellin-like protein